MKLNELRVEGTIHTPPREAKHVRGCVEFILLHETAAVDGSVRFFPVVMYARLAEFFGLRQGDDVLLLGSLERRHWTDRRGHCRTQTVIRAREAKHLKKRPRSALATAIGAELEASEEIPF